MARRSMRLGQFVGFGLLMMALASCGVGGTPTSKAPVAPAEGQVKVDIRAFQVTPNVSSVHAGPVTFTVTNSDVQQHEMLVVPFPAVSPANGGGKAPAKTRNDGPLEQVMSRMVYDNAVLRLDEKFLGSLGEVANIEGGTGGQVTLDLPAGEYLLLCNLPAHFQSGMWTKLTVTR